MSIFERLCFGCGISIDDLHYLMIANRSWHLSCLKCSDCGISFEQEETCFTTNGMILCKDDYRRRSCVCTRCNTIIQPDEIIHRVEDFIFHLKCLTCVNCDVLLHSGDQFGLKANQIYCRDHLLDQQQLFNSHLILDDSGYHTSPNETCQPKIDDEHSFTLSPRFSSSSYCMESVNNQSHQFKEKRLRTSFKHQQLRYMRSYFYLNHNPDAKDLKKLSEKTNLSKRVLQVWFQNARAKYRRSHTPSKDDRRNISSPITASLSPS